MDHRTNQNRYAGQTLKVEEVYVSGYEALSDVAERLPKFFEKVYNAKRLYSALGDRSPEKLENQLAQHASWI